MHFRGGRDEQESMHSVLIIGAGPAGLMASIEAARRGVSVTLLERGDSAGRKLLFTGGGRCNLTHQGDVDHFIHACSPYGNYLKPSFYGLAPERLAAFFEERGLLMVAESNGCVFPKTGRAADVRRILLQEAERLGVEIRFNCRVNGIEKCADDFILHTENERLSGRAVIIATGGVSWPQTGSTGDGYRWAQKLGHSILAPIALLCPVVCREPWPGLLQGTSLEQAVITVQGGRKSVACRGALVFTEDGIGGPAAFDVSRASADRIRSKQPVGATLDFYPHQEKDSLEAEWIDVITRTPKKEMGSLLSAYVPKRVSELLLSMASIKPQTVGAQLSREHRKRLLHFFKEMPLTVIRHGSIEKATVTGGGIDHREVDSKTMQSRLCPGLFFAGEIIDVDGPCGGYNLQIAFSTGALAGRSAAVTQSHS